MQGLGHKLNMVTAYLVFVRYNDHFAVFKPSGPALGINEDGTFIPKWAFTSLLGVFGFSVWQSLVGGNSVRHCNRIKYRNVFLTAQYNRTYCSLRCKQTEEKARQRKAKRKNQASKESTGIHNEEK